MNQNALQAQSVVQLKAIAKSAKMVGFSTMRKAQLINAILQSGAGGITLPPAPPAPKITVAMPPSPPSSPPQKMPKTKIPKQMINVKTFLDCSNPNMIVFKGIPPAVFHKVFNACEIFQFPFQTNSIAVLGISMDGLFGATFTDTVRFHSSVDTTGLPIFGAWIIDKKHAADVKKFLKRFTGASSSSDSD